MNVFRFINLDTWEILFRDNFTCQECGYSSTPNLYAFCIFGGLEVHHIDGNRDNNLQSNKITLCRECHLKIAHGGCYNNKPKKSYSANLLTYEQNNLAAISLERLYTENKVATVKRQSGTVRAKS